MNQTLEELSKRTDALTFLNALKVTMQQIKEEATTQEDLRVYMNESCDRTKRLIKKFDNQYRLFARIVTKESPYATDLTIDESIPEDLAEIKEVMEGG